MGFLDQDSPFCNVDTLKIAELECLVEDLEQHLGMQLGQTDAPNRHAVIVSCWDEDQGQARHICRGLNGGVDPFEYSDLTDLESCVLLAT